MFRRAVPILVGLVGALGISACGSPSSPNGPSLEPPRLPASVSVTAGDEQFAVTWSFGDAGVESADDVAVVEMSSDGGSSWASSGLEVPASDSGVVVDSVSNFVAYEVRLAVSGEGGRTPWMEVDGPVVPVPVAYVGPPGALDQPPAAGDVVAHEGGSPLAVDVVLGVTEARLSFADGTGATWGIPSVNVDGTGGVPHWPTGQGASLRASGFVSGTVLEVLVFSPAQRLALFEVSDDGTVDTTVTLPAGTASGAHAVQVRGVRASGAVRTFTLGIRVPNVVIEPSSLDLAVGDQVELDAGLAGATDMASALVWSSDDESIVTVGASGVLSAVAVGTATVRASAAADPLKFDAVTVTVSGTGRVNALSIAGEESRQVPLGETVQLSATVVSTGSVSDEVSWLSSDDSVVSVASSGLVMAQGLGSAVVTAASVANPSVSDSVAVLVGPGSADASTSTIGVSKSSMTTDESVVVTVHLRDAAGNSLTSGGASVALATTLGSLTPVQDAENGTYSATLTSSTTGTATISGSVNGQRITSGDASVSIAQIPSLQNTQWLILDGTSGSESAYAMDINDAGTIVVAGQDAGGAQIVQVYSSSGAHIWKSTVLPSGGNRLYDVAIDAAGSVYVVGLVFDVIGLGRMENTDAFVRKYDATGETVWTDVLFESWGAFYHTAAEIALNGDLIVGGRYGSSDFANGPSEVIYRYTPGGTLLWRSEPFGSISQSWIFDIAVGPQDEIFVPSTRRISGQYSNYPTIREYTANGVFVAESSVDVPDSSNSSATGLAVRETTDGTEVFAIGRTSNSTFGTGVWVSKLADWVWTSYELDQSSSITIGPAGTILGLATGTERFDGQEPIGASDLRIVEVSDSGLLLNSRVLGSEAADAAAAMEFHSSHGLIVAGTVGGSVDEVAGKGAEDILLSRLYR